MEKAVSSDEIVGESANSTSKESHWEFLRHQLRTATNYTNAVESFKTNVLSNHLGESRSSFENWVKVVNNVVRKSKNIMVLCEGYDFLKLHFEFACPHRNIISKKIANYKY